MNEINIAHKMKKSGQLSIEKSITKLEKAPHYNQCCVQGLTKQSMYIGDLLEIISFSVS